MAFLSGLVVGTFSVLLHSLTSFAVADFLLLPLRLIAGEALFVFLDSLLP